MLFLFVTLHSCVELNPGDDARIHGDSDLSETTKLSSTAFKNSVPFFLKREFSPLSNSLYLPCLLIQLLGRPSRMGLLSIIRKIKRKEKEMRILMV